MRFRVFPDLDLHVAEHYARFGTRFAKWQWAPVHESWRGAGVLAMWALILAWQAIKLACRGRP